MEHGVFCKSFINNACEFNEKLYDMTKNEVYDYIQKNSSNNFVYIKFSYKQLGRSEEWFNKQCRDLNGDQLAIRREILLEWCRSSDLSPFSGNDLFRLTQNIHDPIATLTVNKYYNFKIYKDFDFEQTVLIGIDCATGMEEDSSAITICDINGEVLADYKNSVIDTAELTALIYDLMTMYFPNSIIFPERNSVGKAIIDTLLKQPDIISRIYYEKKKVSAEKKASKEYDSSTGKFYTKVYGINTDSSSRPKMIELIRGIIDNDVNKIHSADIINNICGLQRKKNGKIEHGDGDHDDNLFSYLMVRYVLAYGTNLGHFNIFKNRKLTNSNINSTLEDPEMDFKRDMHSVFKLNRKTEYSLSEDIIKDFDERKENTDKLKNPKKVHSADIIFNLNKLF